MISLRPSLIPEPVRPLVLAPIYLVRKFINIFMYFVMGVLSITGLFVATIPSNMAFIGFGIKAFLITGITSVFGGATAGVNSKRRFLISKLDRLEDVCAGDVIAAATLAMDLAQDSATWTSEKAADFFDAAKNVDVGEVAGSAVDSASSAASFVASSSADAIRSAADSSGDVAQAVAENSVNAAKAAAEVTTGAAKKTARFAGWATKGVSNVVQNVTSVAVDETKSLLSDPIGSFGSIAKGTVDAGNKAVGAAADATVNIVETSGELAVNAVGTGVDVGGKIAGKAVEVGTNTASLALEAGKDVVGGATNLTMAGIKQIMAMDPIYIFREIVKMVLRVTFYIVAGLPTFLLGLGVIMWILGIYPSFIQIVLFIGLLVFGMPAAWFWVRKTALEQLDAAGVEVIRVNAEKAANMASGVVGWGKV